MNTLSLHLHAIQLEALITSVVQVRLRYHPFRIQQMDVLA